MPKHISCDSDHFAIGMEELLSDIEPAVAENLSEELPRLGRKGAKELRQEAGERWTGKTGRAYSKGFSSKKVQSGMVTTVEIGNSAMPGLVHLLEKGHETLTSRRVEGIPHVAPVFDRLEPQVVDAVSKAVGEALEG